MKDFLKGLEMYFQNSSKEQILKDWQATNEYVNIGPTTEEFFENCSLCSQPEYLSNIKNPDSFGFSYFTRFLTSIFI